MRKLINIIGVLLVVNLAIAQEITVTKFDKRISKPILLQTQNQKVIGGLSNENLVIDSRKLNAEENKNESNIISDITMIDANNGFAVGSKMINGGYYRGGSEKSMFWKTANGTKTWQEITVSDDIKNYVKLIYIDENKLFLHANPKSFISEDGGVTWSVTGNNPTTYLSKLTVYKSGIIIGVGSTKATYSIDFGNSWQALNLPENFAKETITLEGQMIGAVVQDEILKLYTVSEELNYDISNNQLVERKENNFPLEIRDSKKRFFKSHENGDFTLIFNTPSLKVNMLSSGISVYSSSDNTNHWVKEFDYKEDNLLHISDVKKDVDGLYVVTPQELIFYQKENNKPEARTRIKENKKTDLSSGFNIYPNPTTGVINIQSNENIDNIRVVDMYGKQILNTRSQAINLTNQPKGIYFVHIQNGDQQVIEKIVVVK